MINIYKYTYIYDTILAAHYRKSCNLSEGTVGNLWLFILYS